MTVLVFLRAPDEAASVDFRRWVVSDFGARLADPASGLTRAIVTVCAASPDGPDGLDLPATMRLNGSNTQPWPGYDAALTLEGPDEAVAACWAGEMAARTDLRHVYRVSERVMIDKERITPGRPSNGMTYMRGIHFHADLPRSAWERSWTLHAPLAIKVHVGVSRYTQWYVEEILSEGSPGIGGIAELHFPTVKDMVEGFFDSPRGRDEIAQDTRHFIAGGPPRLFAEQHVFV